MLGKKKLVIMKNLLFILLYPHSHGASGLTAGECVKGFLLTLFVLVIFLIYELNNHTKKGGTK